MKLRELTSDLNEDGLKILRVRGRVSDRADRGEQTEWIEFQVAVDVPIGRHGAQLPAEVLERARDTLDQLAKHFRHLFDQAHS